MLAMSFFDCLINTPRIPYVLSYRERKEKRERSLMLPAAVTYTDEHSDEKNFTKI